MKHENKKHEKALAKFYESHGVNKMSDKIP